MKAPIIRPAVVTIGDELMLGERENGNQRWLLQTLWQRGRPAECALSLPDELSTIARWIRTLSEQLFFPILISGGLGGTHDDCTRQAVAQGLGVALTRHPECFALLAQRYAERFTEQRQRMAWLPEGCALIANPLGAPGFHLRGVYGFPGFPTMLQPMASEILEHLMPQAQATQWLKQEYRLAIGEGDIALEIEAFAQLHPQTRIGIYPSTENWRKEVTLCLRSPVGEPQVREQFETLLQRLAKHFQIECVSLHEPESVSSKI